MMVLLHVVFVATPSRVVVVAATFVTIYELAYVPAIVIARVAACVDDVVVGGGVALISSCCFCYCWYCCR
jgi:hypothetical protein